MNIPLGKIRVLDEEKNRSNGKPTDIIISSVQYEGVLVPILVYEEGDYYVLVAGHRRLESARFFGLENIPAEVISKDKAVTARVLENIDRKNLHPLDEAAEILALMNKGYSRTQISTILEIPESRVAKRVKLLSLTEKMKEMFKNGEFDLACAEEFAIIPPELQVEVFDSCSSWNMTPEEIRREYFSQAGISLDNCSEKFINLNGVENTGCRQCPHNPVSDEVLFAECETCGLCKNTDCYLKKLAELIKVEGVKGIADSGFYGRQADDIKSLLKEKSVECIRLNSYIEESRIEKSNYNADGEKYINLKGNVVYDIATCTRKPEAGDEIDPIEAKINQLVNDCEDYFTKLKTLKRDYARDTAKNYEQTLDKPYDRTSREYVLSRALLMSNSPKANLMVGTEKKIDFIESMSANAVIAYGMVCALTDGILTDDNTWYLSRWKDKDTFSRGFILTFAERCNVEQSPIAQKIENLYSKIEKAFDEYNQLKEEERKKEEEAEE